MKSFLLLRDFGGVVTPVRSYLCEQTANKDREFLDSTVGEAASIVFTVQEVELVETTMKKKKPKLARNQEQRPVAGDQE